MYPPLPSFFFFSPCLCFWFALARLWFGSSGHISLSRAPAPLLRFTSYSTCSLSLSVVYPPSPTPLYQYECIKRLSFFSHSTPHFASMYAHRRGCSRCTPHASFVFVSVTPVSAREFEPSNVHVATPRARARETVASRCFLKVTFKVSISDLWC